MADLHCTIQTRQGAIYDGDVVAISGKNNHGPFDVLPQHANFISIVEGTIVLHEKSGATKEFPVTHGVVRVESNNVQILIGLK